MHHIIDDLRTAKTQDEFEDILTEHKCIQILDPDSMGSVTYIVDEEAETAMCWEFPFTINEVSEQPWVPWLEEMIKLNKEDQ